MRVSSLKRPLTIAALLLGSLLLFLLASSSNAAYLLPLEHVLVKVLLQLFVGEVDAELLKIIEGKRLKPWRKGGGQGEG